eukprot:10677153-Heterocapsa_arctica.AAC.1
MLSELLELFGCFDQFDWGTRQGSSPSSGTYSSPSSRSRRRAMRGRRRTTPSTTSEGRGGREELWCRRSP